MRIYITMQTKLVTLPQELGDGRLDTLLSAFNKVRSMSQSKTKLIVDCSRLSEITPAGYAIIACLVDIAREQNTIIEFTQLSKQYKKNTFFKAIKNDSIAKLLHLDLSVAQVDAKSFLFEGSTVSPHYIEKIANKISKNLSDDQEFAFRLLSNELIQNSIDHSSGEKYYAYAGIFKNEFHFGVLDMGVSIPASLEQKYSSPTDINYLELSLQEGVGTRRLHPGGLGLYYFFEILKQEKGRLVIVSRNASIRKYFKGRNNIKTRLKHTLYGTWCFARIKLT